MSPCPDWYLPERDEQLQFVVAGLSEFYRFIVSACKRRYIMGHGDIKTYHRKVFVRVVPLEYYAGNYRCNDSTKPCLAKDVAVNGIPGLPFAIVPSEMSDFSAELHDLTVQTDEYIAHPVSSTERAQAVAQLAAATMGKIVRIHPFLNGNGRMARMAVNYIFRRYGYAMPFRQSQIRPPETEYGQASAAAMGASPNFRPLYIYLLKLVARVAASSS